MGRLFLLLFTFFILPKAHAGSYLDLFCETYDDCRSQFLRTAKNFSGETKVWSEDLPSEIPHDNLTVDFAFFPAANSQRLLLLTSGIHGLEGFTGSTLQTFFIQKMLRETLARGISVLMVHGINAYGFKHGSRYTENRIDLNRNWFVGEEFPSPDDKIYDRFASFLNPPYRATYGSIDFAWFMTRRLLPWTRSALNGKLTQAAGQGQYRYAEGVEFGGRAYEPQRKIFLDQVAPYLEKFPQVLHLDLHTGLGKKAMQLLPNAPKQKAIGERRRKIFKSVAIEATGSSTFYSSFGDFSDFVCDWVSAAHPEHLCTNMLIEYGTLIEGYWQQWPKIARAYKENSKSAFTLYLTVRENQLHHYGARSEKEAKKLETDYRLLFYPRSLEWRLMVLSESMTEWPKFISNFAN